jgi:hypothetical protein
VLATIKKIQYRLGHISGVRQKVHSSRLDLTAATGQRENLAARLRFILSLMVTWRSLYHIETIGHLRA